MKNKDKKISFINYQKPKIETHKEVPIAGGCGDGPNSCSCHSYYRQGGGCGDHGECQSQAYWK